MKNNFLIAVLLLPAMIFAQERVPFNGKVSYDGMALENILVVNLQLQKETRTDSFGNFTLPAKPGDEIVITDSRIREQKHKLTPEDLQDNPLVFSVDIQAYELKEVVVNRQRISKSILNIPMGPKFTPVERKYETASRTRPFYDLQMTGAFIPLDPLFNAISGRTKYLKKTIDVEKKEYSIAMLSDMYDEKEIIAEFRIPAEYVKGFLFYIAENMNVAAALKARNITLAKKLIAPLALQYLQLITNDK